MKLLLDENLPTDLRHFLPGHEVFSVEYMEWKGIGNGELLAKAAAAGFEAVLTKDAEIEYQQNTAELPTALVVIRAKTNALSSIMPLVPELLRELARLSSRTIVRVG